MDQAVAVLDPFGLWQHGFQLALGDLWVNGVRQTEQFADSLDVSIDDDS